MFGFVWWGGGSTSLLCPCLHWGKVNEAEKKSFKNGVRGAGGKGATRQGVEGWRHGKRAKNPQETQQKLIPPNEKKRVLLEGRTT